MNKAKTIKVLSTLAVIAGLLILTFVLLNSRSGPGKLPPGLSDEEKLQQRQKELNRNRMLVLQERERRKNRFGRTFRKRGESGNSSLVMLEGRIGTQNIPVIAGGVEKSFTGQDLGGLERVTVAFQQNALAGWPPLDVLRRLEIENGKVLTLFNGEGKTLNLSREQLIDDWPKVVFTYDPNGSLTVLSGTELSPDEIQTVDPKSLPDPGPEGVFFPGIVKIEVKS